MKVAARQKQPEACERRFWGISKVPLSAWGPHGLVHLGLTGTMAKGTAENSNGQVAGGGEARKRWRRQEGGGGNKKWTEGQDG
jgi:hypothetical protein